MLYTRRRKRSSLSRSDSSRWGGLAICLRSKRLEQASVVPGYSRDKRVKTLPDLRSATTIRLARRASRRRWHAPRPPRKGLERQAVRAYPDDAAVLPHQGRASRHPGVLPDGGLLRALLRRCREGLAPAR